jgi:predicted PurR-regulated permease PerM
MVGDSIGISPLATLFFLYIGYRLYGIVGMIIGVPVGMVIINLYRVGMFDRLIKGFKIIIHDLNEFRKF